MTQEFCWKIKPQKSRLVKRSRQYLNSSLVSRRASSKEKQKNKSKGSIEENEDLRSSRTKVKLAKDIKYSWLFSSSNPVGKLHENKDREGYRARRLTFEIEGQASIVGEKESDAQCPDRKLPERNHEGRKGPFQSQRSAGETKAKQRVG